MNSEWQWMDLGLGPIECLSPDLWSPKAMESVSKSTWDPIFISSAVLNHDLSCLPMHESPISFWLGTDTLSCHISSSIKALDHTYIRAARYSTSTSSIDLSCRLKSNGLRYIAISIALKRISLSNSAHNWKWTRYVVLILWLSNLGIRILSYPSISANYICLPFSNADNVIQSPLKSSRVEFLSRNQSRNQRPTLRLQ
jgi:hypothetical protein